jgi:hypothetical protein
LRLAKVVQDVWVFVGKNIFLTADLMVATVVMVGIFIFVDRRA